MTSWLKDPPKAGVPNLEQTAGAAARGRAYGNGIGASNPMKAYGRKASSQALPSASAWIGSSNNPPSFRSGDAIGKAATTAANSRNGDDVTRNDGGQEFRSGATSSSSSSNSRRPRVGAGTSPLRTVTGSERNRKREDDVRKRGADAYGDERHDDGAGRGASGLDDSMVKLEVRVDDEDGEPRSKDENSLLMDESFEYFNGAGKRPRKDAVLGICSTPVDEAEDRRKASRRGLSPIVLSPSVKAGLNLDDGSNGWSDEEFASTREGDAGGDRYCGSPLTPSDLGSNSALLLQSPTFSLDGHDNHVQSTNAKGQNSASPKSRGKQSTHTQRRRARSVTLGGSPMTPRRARAARDRHSEEGTGGGGASTEVDADSPTACGVAGPCTDDNTPVINDNPVLETGNLADVSHLWQDLCGEQHNKHVVEHLGFGKGFVIKAPLRYSKAERERFVGWIKKLGFETRAFGDQQPAYTIPKAEADGLRRQIAALNRKRSEKAVSAMLDAKAKADRRSTIEESEPTTSLDEVAPNTTSSSPLAKSEVTEQTGQEGGAASKRSARLTAMFKGGAKMTRASTVPEARSRSSDAISRGCGRGGKRRSSRKAHPPRLDGGDDDDNVERRVEQIEKEGDIAAAAGLDDGQPWKRPTQGGSKPKRCSTEPTSSPDSTGSLADVSGSSSPEDVPKRRGQCRGAILEDLARGQLSAGLLSMGMQEERGQRQHGSGAIDVHGLADECDCHYDHDGDRSTDRSSMGLEMHSMMCIRGSMAGYRTSTESLRRHHSDESIRRDSGQTVHDSGGEKHGSITGIRNLETEPGGNDCIRALTGFGDDEDGDDDAEDFNIRPRRYSADFSTSRDDQHCGQPFLRTIGSLAFNELTGGEGAGPSRFNKTEDMGLGLGRPPHRRASTVDFRMRSTCFDRPDIRKKPQKQKPVAEDEEDEEGAEDMAAGKGVLGKHVLGEGDEDACGEAEEGGDGVAPMIQSAIKAAPMHAIAKGGAVGAVEWKGLEWRSGGGSGSGPVGGAGGAPCGGAKISFTPVTKKGRVWKTKKEHGDWGTSGEASPSSLQHLNVLYSSTFVDHHINCYKQVKALTSVCREGGGHHTRTASGDHAHAFDPHALSPLREHAASGTEEEEGDGDGEEDEEARNDRLTTAVHMADDLLFEDNDMCSRGSVYRASSRSRRSSLLTMDPAQRSESRKRRSVAKMKRVSLGQSMRNSLGLCSRLQALNLSFNIGASALAAATIAIAPTPVTGIAPRNSGCSSAAELSGRPSAVGASLGFAILGGVFLGKLDYNGKPIVQPTNNLTVVLVEVRERGSKVTIKLQVNTQGENGETTGDRQESFGPGAAFGMVVSCGVLISRSPLDAFSSAEAYLVKEEVFAQTTLLKHVALTKTPFDEIIEEVDEEDEGEEEEEEEEEDNEDDDEDDISPVREKPSRQQQLKGRVDDSLSPLTRNLSTISMDDTVTPAAARRINRRSREGDIKMDESAQASIRSLRESSAAVAESCGVEGRMSIVEESGGEAGVVAICPGTSPMVALPPHLLVMALAFLPLGELRRSAGAVCRKWADAASFAYAERVADITCTSAPEPGWNAAKMAGVFPWGCFLSSGAYKEVYRVLNSSTKGEEALSVMNTELIASLGNSVVVAQELRITILASALVSRHVCPNYIMAHGLFRSADGALEGLWGSEKDRFPRGKMPSKDLLLDKWTAAEGAEVQEATTAPLPFQYISMELCTQGDIEHYIETLPSQLLPEEDTRIMLFQMIFSLYAGQVKYSLRHYDIKLLNFLLKDISTSALDCKGEGEGQEETESSVCLHYGFGAHVYELCMPRERALMVKLADFGTGNVDPSTLGQPIGMEHFTTFENTPVEQLIAGQGAIQDFNKDTFSLALAVVHLFTGKAPYEAIMDEVTCPASLKAGLSRAWGSNKQTHILLELSVATDGDVDEDALLYDTFYRFLVLFGLPRMEELETAYGCTNAVVCCLRNLTKSGARKRGKEEECFVTRFQKDTAKFSIATGSHKMIARARERIERMEGAMELLMGLANFDPAKRPTMAEALESSFFKCLRVAEGEEGEDMLRRRANGGSFMYFYRPVGEETQV